jgi:hypothetical protein
MNAAEMKWASLSQSNDQAAAHSGMLEPHCENEALHHLVKIHLICVLAAGALPKMPTCHDKQHDCLFNRKDGTIHFARGQTEKHIYLCTIASVFTGHMRIAMTEGKTFFQNFPQLDAVSSVHR